MAEIVRLRSANKSESDGIVNLLGELYAKESPKVKGSFLKKLLADSRFELWVAKEGGEFVGIAALVGVPLLRGDVCRIEDVVVSEAHRGRGIGKKLIKRLIARAKEKKYKKIDLTSRPFRVVANEMYKKLGFEKQETNVYRMSL